MKALSLKIHYFPKYFAFNAHCYANTLLYWNHYLLWYLLYCQRAFSEYLTRPKPFVHNIMQGNCSCRNIHTVSFKGKMKLSFAITLMHLWKRWYCSMMKPVKYCKDLLWFTSWFSDFTDMTSLRNTMFFFIIFPLCSLKLFDNKIKAITVNIG